MRSRSNGPEDYLSRVASQLKHMPAEARAELEDELRQHLEALTASRQLEGLSDEAAMDEALERFGDPIRVGQSLMTEWRRTMNKTRSALLRLIVSVGIGQAAVWSVCLCVLFATQLSLFSAVTSAMTGALQAKILLYSSVFELLHCLVPLAAGIVLGLRLPPSVRPEQAVPIALYASLLFMPFAMMLPGVLARFMMELMGKLHGMFTFSPTAPPYDWIVMECLAAFAACLYRRGGTRRLRSADWKLRAQ